MPDKVLILTGSPNADDLDWDPSKLSDGFTIPVSRFAGLVHPNTGLDSSSLVSPPPKVAAWRSLRLTREHLTTGHSQDFGAIGLMNPYEYPASFLSTSELSFASSGGSVTPSEDAAPNSSSGSSKDILSQFYEHSFAIHQDIASSQIPATAAEHSTADDDSDVLSNDTSSEPQPAPPRHLPVPPGSHLSDLEDIPTAAYLQAIRPQTMTVNLIVGLISITGPRTINTRRGATVQLVELLVGDETKSGFLINCWLSARDAAPTRRRVLAAGDNNNHNPMGEFLAGLRPQDIILLRNVALSSFRGRVHGQTLRRDLTRGYLLYRSRVDASDVGGFYAANELRSAAEVHPQLAKTKRVRGWVLRFVGGGDARPVGKGRGGFEVAEEILPPDTQ